MRTAFLHIALAFCLVQDVCADKKECWFPVGEKLCYRLYWGVIPVGSCEMTTGWVTHEGREMLSIKATAKTTAVVSKIYPVDDFIESIVNPETFLPLQYTQKLHEGRRIRSDLVKFNHAGGVATWSSARSSEASKIREIGIEADTRDVLCLAYFMRSKGLSVGQREKFKVLVDDKIYELDVSGIGYETMAVDNVGDVKCLVVEPMAKFGEIFVRKGKVNLWFSEDLRRICTRMAGKLSFASLKAVLTAVEGPGDDAWSNSGGRADKDKRVSTE